MQVVGHTGHQEASFLHSMCDALCLLLQGVAGWARSIPTPGDMAELNLPTARMQPGGEGTAVDADTSASRVTSATNSRAFGPWNETTGTTLPSARQEDANYSFILSEGLAPVPTKLMAKNRKGEFIDMVELLHNNVLAELLHDNVQAHHRGMLQDPMEGGTPPAKHLQWEEPDMISWVQCFGIFKVVVASVNPDKLRLLLVYQTTIVRETRGCGRKG